ncbi:MAG: hypothetical protein WC495_00075 [Patescibacteria group bacterium]|jgi:hypothetical protein
MPGIHTLIHKPGAFPKPILESDFDFTLHKKNFTAKIFYQSITSTFAASLYDGYPFKFFTYNEVLISIEGFIYNFSKSDLETRLFRIADELRKNEESCQKLIGDFVNSADGDFIIQMWDIKTQTYLLFNDFFNRLSVYFYKDDTMLLISKEIKTLLTFIPSIHLNQNTLVEYVLREHPLGTKTLFTNINRLTPRNILILKIRNNSLSLTAAVSVDWNFKEKKRYLSRKESINDLNKKFSESIRNRVQTIQEHGYSIIADLSGGFDTRTILAGLSKTSKNVQYFTFEYIRDESQYAQAIFQAMGSPGSYHKIKFNNSQVDDLSQLVYTTDGLVNYYTTGVCFNDVKELYKQAPANAVRFSGLGGEFIRHPYKNFYFSLLKGFEHGFYETLLPINTACRLFKVNPSNFRKTLGKYLKSYPEKNTSDKLKHLYYEYYNNYVGIAAEERERIHFWTAQPLWGTFFLKAIYERLPLRWANFRYHVDLLKSLSHKLITFPFYGQNFKPSSEISMWFFDFIYWLKRNSLTKIIIKKIIKPKRPHEDELINQIFEQQKSLTHLNNVVDVNFIGLNNFPKAILRRILTLLMYFREIEKRHGEKL